MADDCFEYMVEYSVMGRNGDDWIDFHHEVLFSSKDEAQSYVDKLKIEDKVLSWNIIPLSIPATMED